MDLKFKDHLARQIAFSRATFGPGSRTEGVVDHIREELAEVVSAKTHDEKVEEWVDVVILGLDGLTRELVEKHKSTNAAAEIAVWSILRKQDMNEQREWPNWRTQDNNKKIKALKR